MAQRIPQSLRPPAAASVEFPSTHLFQKARCPIPRAAAEVQTVIPDNPNWRRFKYSCPFYRERWAMDGEQGEEGRDLLYQVICLQNTPPATLDEQDLCMETKSVCWRLKQARKAARTA